MTVGLQLGMSTAVPILERENIKKLIEWMRTESNQPGFDPTSEEFQAAISLLSVNDQFRQSRALQFADSNHLAMSVGTGITQNEVPLLSQVLLYRHLLHNIHSPPQIQRSAIPLYNPEEQMPGNPSANSLIYLTPHTDDFEVQLKSPDMFRNSFVFGDGQSSSFLAERRVAILSSIITHLSPNTPKYKDMYTIVSCYNRRLKMAAAQYQLRKSLCKFPLDPTASTIPDYSRLYTPYKNPEYTLSPHHIGIIPQYDISTSMDTAQTSLHIQIINQANKFRSALNAAFSRNVAIKHALEQHKKDIEKERNKAKKTQERIRWDLLKQKDMVKYRETVKQMKDKRIQQLLDQTDHYMKELSDKIRLTHSKHVENNQTVNTYDFDLKLPEDVTQPSSLTGVLKEYQVKGLQWLVSLYQSKLNGILADEMGLGKTIQTIALLAWLFEKYNDTGPHLVCAPLSTLSNWESEFKQWFPQFKVVKYIGSPQERKELERNYINRGSKINAIMTSYEFIVRDKSVLGRLDYSYIVIDEAHKLKNHQGKLSQTLSHHYNSKNRLLLTGTPLQNNPRELWSLLNFILPTIFNDHNKFDDWFTAPFAKAGETSTLSPEEQWIVVNQLHAVLRPFLFRRMKCDVADQLPDKKEATILCAMSAWQHSMYITMEESSVYITPELKAIRMDNKVMQCRKICNHPYLFQDTYYVNAMLIRSCGKFELLDRILPKLFATGHRVLIFSQMTELLDLLEDLLKLLNFNFLRLDGSTKAENRQKLMDDFNAHDSEYFVFLLSTRAGGLGLNLQSADTVIIYDNDWNPFADMQASSRVHRIGQEKEVLVINLSTPDTVERKVLDVAGQKRTVEDIIIGVAMFNDESNIDERKAVYQAVTAKNQTGGVSNIPDDAQINKIIARSPEEQERFDQMDLDRDERYQREWERLGNPGDYPRLVTYDELPDYLKVQASDLIKEEELPEIRKSRSKNQLSLLDNITDQEYTRLVEEGRDPGDCLPEIQILREKCNELIKIVAGIVENRFDTLPTQADLPEYYEVIKTPITFITIRKRVKSGSYESVEDLISDLILMAQNAMRFNDPHTEFYKNGEDVINACQQYMANGSNTKFSQIPSDSSTL